ncbi:hypothetical protein [Mycobacterium sp. 852002-51961_SCH5331710]|uniref:hypothetical protein n=1 Tax=Mycobacterium sp. 852002-51961_SCH5331710 TaxID=1834105 RepID=UPI0008001250|nr:hypothetical protein [Mycobacterium sp. 852002-51961_SCH5331710]OBB42436.1 hypothetical protein A5752_06985 [Mycobacterium sp. 852002-51961_SCH5331710]
MFTALFAFVCIVYIGTTAASLLPSWRLSVPEPGEADERVATADDIRAARAEFDRTLVRKGLLTDDRLELIRSGVRSPAVVTAMRPTGQALEDCREVELDVMVKKPGGGQFPAHETTLVPASALVKVSPGSVIDTYYRPGDESAVAICVAPA